MGQAVMGYYRQRREKLKAIFRAILLDFPVVKESRHTRDRKPRATAKEQGERRE
jgi:hypothetical protein